MPLRQWISLHWGSTEHRSDLWLFSWADNQHQRCQYSRVTEKLDCAANLIFAWSLVAAQACNLKYMQNWMNQILSDKILLASTGSTQTPIFWDVSPFNLHQRALPLFSHWRLNARPIFPSHFEILNIPLYVRYSDFKTSSKPSNMIFITSLTHPNNTCQKTTAAVLSINATELIIMQKYCDNNKLLPHFHAQLHWLTPNQMSWIHQDQRLRVSSVQQKHTNTCQWTYIMSFCWIGPLIWSHLALA